MSKTKNLCMCACFAVMLAVGAFIKIPTPLPLTCQTMVVSLSALVLGAKWGAASVLTYIFIGLAGLPVFSSGGGIFYVLQPSFGYILGFLAASFIIGALSERKNTVKGFILPCLLGTVAIYIIGAVYFYLISRFYLEQAMEIKHLIITCVLLPLPGDIVMCILSSLIAPRLKKALK